MLFEVFVVSTWCVGFFVICYWIVVTVSEMIAAVVRHPDHSRSRRERPTNHDLDRVSSTGRPASDTSPDLPQAENESVRVLGRLANDCVESDLGYDPRKQCRCGRPLP